MPHWRLNTPLPVWVSQHPLDNRNSFLPNEIIGIYFLSWKIWEKKKKESFMDKMFKSTSTAQELKCPWQTCSSDWMGGVGVSLDHLGRKDFQLFLCTYCPCSWWISLFGALFLSWICSFQLRAWSSLRQLLRCIDWGVRKDQCIWSRKQLH